MTVKELIEMLKRFPGDLPVMTCDEKDRCWELWGSYVTVQHLEKVRPSSREDPKLNHGWEKSFDETTPLVCVIGDEFS